MNNELPDFDFVDLSDDFSALMESSVESIKKEFKIGEKVSGKITDITAQGIFVNINAKSEGIIATGEFMEDDVVTVAVGDEIEAYFVSESGGELSLTTRMSGDALMDSLSEAFAAQVPVEGKVVEERKGGYTIKIGQNEAFCPFSQIDRGRSGDPEMYIGQTFIFIISQLSDRNFVVSRRLYLDKEAVKNVAILKDELAEGDIIEGVVRKIESFGVFVDIGGIDGLIPLSELSWTRNFDASDLVSPGQKVNVLIRNLDWQKERIVLSLRGSDGDPWDSVGDKYHFSKRYEGTVTKTESYGAFVALEPGVEGLLHISKLTDGKIITHADQAVSVGDQIEVFIDNIDLDQKRISLTQELQRKRSGGDQSPQVTTGSTVTGKVEGVKEFGVFIGLGDGKTGLLHISQMKIQGNDRFNEMRKLYQEGQEVEVRIDNIAGKRISLALPQSADEINEKQAVKNYLNKEKSSDFGSLGDVFGDLNI